MKNSRTTAFGQPTGGRALAAPTRPDEAHKPAQAPAAPPARPQLAPTHLALAYLTHGAVDARAALDRFHRTSDD